MRNSQEFWHTVKLLRPKTFYPHTIMAILLRRNLSPLRAPRSMYFDCAHSQFESNISLDEQNRNLDRCNRNKVAGCDDITSESYVNVPDNWLHYIQTLFNLILMKKEVPNSWSSLSRE